MSDAEKQQARQNDHVVLTDAQREELRKHNASLRSPQQRDLEVRALQHQKAYNEFKERGDDYVVEKFFTPDDSLVVIMRSGMMYERPVGGVWRIYCEPVPGTRARQTYDNWTRALLKAHPPSTEEHDDA
jgi:hypothetical protein